MGSTVAGFPFLSKKDAVAEFLRREILQRRLEPGARLRQNAVALRLGVSATPIREAFGVLHAEGLLSGQPHRGMVVAKVEPSDWTDYYEMRRLIEVHALRRVRHVPPETVDELDRCVKAGVGAIRHPDIHAFRIASARFHELVVEACGSRAFAEIAKMLMARSLFFIPLERVRLAEVVREHRSIVDALRGGDWQRAATLMDEHLTRTTHNLQKHAMRDADSARRVGHRRKSAS